MREGDQITELSTIPEGWRFLRLGDIIKLSSGDALTKTNSEKGIYPVYGGNGIAYYHSQFNQTDSVLIIGRVGAYCGCVYLTEGKSWITDNALYIKEKLKDYDDKYMFYNLNKLDLNSYANKNAQPVISGQKIYPITIPLPPLPEQQKIATILSTVDEKLEVIDSQISQIRELKKGLMQKLLKHGIGHTKFKDSVLGEIPESWEIKYLSTLGDIVSGGTPDTKITEYWNGDIQWCTPTDITSLKGKRYIGHTGRTITDLGLKNSSAKIIPSNSVIVCTRATIGDCAINSNPLATNQGFKSIIPNENWDVHFVYYLINSLKDTLIKLSSGSTFLEISKKAFEGIAIPFPTISEQKEIASILIVVDDKLDILLTKKESYRELKKGLMQQLLTGKVRVFQSELEIA